VWRKVPGRKGVTPKSSLIDAQSDRKSKYLFSLCAPIKMAMKGMQMGFTDEIVKHTPGSWDFHTASLFSIKQSTNCALSRVQRIDFSAFLQFGFLRKIIFSFFLNA
jgi:hypothetical protein